MNLNRLQVTADQYAVKELTTFMHKNRGIYPFTYISPVTFTELNVWLISSLQVAGLCCV